MKKIKILIILSIPILLLTQLVINNSLATKGQELKDLQARISSLEETNRNLQTTLSQKKSLENIAGQAQELGFVPVEDQINITPEALALRN